MIIVVPYKAPDSVKLI